MLPGVRRATIACCLLALAPIAACAGSDGEATGDAASGTTGASTTTTTGAGAAGAQLAPLEGGQGLFLATGAAGVDLDAAGYVEEELTASGTATSYRSRGELPADGRFELDADQEAEYRTRLVVRRPAEAAAFNGTVVVEWLNVSGGIDASPDWTYMADELLRGGYAWVGVSAQHIGVEGGEAAVTVDAAAGLAGRGLRGLDPERYGSLHHPGDAFAYDIFHQVGRAVRDGDALADLRPERVLAVGESQSAFALTTYVNGVHPLDPVFDGFLLHSRAGAPLPLGEPGAAVGVADAISLPATRIRDDLDVPVLIVQSETDLVGFMNFHAARQPDTDRLRVWEIAGTAHADTYQLGALAGSVGCPTPINDGPQHLVVKAALRALDQWVATGEAPAAGPPLEVRTDGGSPVIARDADGIALGGIRLPQVEAPVVALSGDAGPGSSIICLLLGSTNPIDPSRLAARYPSADHYLAAYEAAADAAIDAGFVLPEDREALLADADPSVLEAAP
jgi:hypothetical protein